jgi:putative ABC transport system permease protein
MTDIRGSADASLAAWIAGVLGTSMLSLRFAGREMRGGLRGFIVFLGCIALGVAAIAGVSAVASALADGLAREGSTILGADISFSLSMREASVLERGVLERHGRVSLAANMRAMARVHDGRAALVEVKAVDTSYPLYGTVSLDPALAIADALSERDGVFGAAADPALLVRLNLAPGARVALGSATVEIRAALISEPDKLSSGIGFGPRLLISERALRETGLVLPGSVVRWHYRLRLPDSTTDAAVRSLPAAVERELPEAGWEIRTRGQASPALARNVERFTQYLTLVGLAALLVGGVGVANAVKAHLDRRREVIATLKSLGATGSCVFAIYLVQAVALAAAGALPGLAIGAALPFIITAVFGSVLPLPLVPALHPGNLALAFLYGLLTALTFALWPLGRAHDLPASALFRDEVAGEAHRPRWRYVIGVALLACAFAALAVALAYDRRVAVIFVIAALGTFVLLQLLAALLMHVARILPHVRSPVVRLAIANVHRPGALTPSVVISLGLGLALLVTVIAIEGNLRRQFLAALPQNAPSFYFLDIPAEEAGDFDAFVRAQAPAATLERVPMMRGRIVAVNGEPVEKLKPPPDTAWALQSDRGITYADRLPAGSRLVAGEWWQPDYQGPPLVSFEQRIADGLGLRVGDTVTVNVLGRNITAKVANLRAVDWQSLGINFVMVFSPATLRGAPSTQIATLAYPTGTTPDAEVAMLKTIAQAFPTVTAVRVREALDAVGQTVTKLVFGIRAASGLTLLIALFVLAGALAAGHRQRVYDAIILRTLGATRMRLIAVYVVEYCALGLAAGVFGVAAGVAASAYILIRMMNLSFHLIPGPLLVCLLGAVSCTVVVGLIGTFSALGQKPAPMLRKG